MRQGPIRAGTLALDLLAVEWNSPVLMAELPLPGCQGAVLPEAACQLRLLGDFSLAVRKRPAATGRGIAEMLALLGIVGSMSRERMQAILWPSADPVLAAGRLRSLVYRVRQISTEEVVACDPPSLIALNPAVIVDFQVASAAAFQLAHQHVKLPVSLLGLTTLLGAELLPMHSWEWLAPHQHAWSRTRLRALDATARVASQQGDHETAIIACEKVILAEPFHEGAHYTMIIALLREGYERAARNAYDRLSALLADELGCTPRQTYQDLRSRAVQPVS